MDWTHPAVVVVLTLLAGALCKAVLIFAWSGGTFARWGLANRSFFGVLRDPAVADRVAAALVPPPPPPPPQPPKPSAEPLRLLTLLQREGRLLDFLLEDISSASDEQIGAGVRELHGKAQAVIQEHLTLTPVMNQSEGETVEVPAGFDPSAIQVVGNVTGAPPYRGALRHHGWRVTSYKLPAGPEGRDEFIVAPAEVEIP